ncbi:MAG: transporter [Verrucomicrobia bacterium]|nr:transporter [Verrucomicrobiota bacterium]
MKDPQPPGKIWRVGTLVYGTAGLVSLFGWLLLGDFAWSTKERSAAWVVQLLLRKYQASDMLAGLLIGTLPQALVLVLTPIVSFRSDRHRGPRGRRIPFLLVPTVVAAGSMLGLAASPLVGEWLHRHLGSASPGLNPSILIVFGICWTLFEVATVTANSVFFGLINDVVPAEVLGRFYGLFRAVGLVVAMGFNFWLLGKAETHATWIFVGIGLLYGGGFTTMCFKVKEGEYPPPPAVPRRAGAGVRAYFRESFSVPYFRWIYATITLSWMAIMTINLFNLYFAQSVGMSLDIYGRYLAATFLISFVVSYGIGMLADSLHPLRLGLIAMALLAVVTLAGAFLIRDARSFGIALIAYGVTSGAWQTATASLAMRLFPAARFAQIESARALVTSLGLMLVGPAMGRFLDVTGHDYRAVYAVGGTLAVLAVATGLVVLRRFRQLGGPRHYRPPES